MSRVTGLGWLAAVLLAALPAYAHEVEISSDVGATLHIEPDDKPKAGQPTQVWFALTTKGGQVIPLSACDCQLKLYSEREGTSALQVPPLTEKAVEQYQGIPSAEVTFPQIGAYKLELSGSPKPSAKFAPFSLSYKVVVAGKSEVSKEPDKGTELKPTTPDKQAETGKKIEVKGESKLAMATEARRNTSVTESPDTNIWWTISSGIVLVAGIVGAAIWLFRSNSD